MSVSVLLYVFSETCHVSLTSWLLHTLFFPVSDPDIPYLFPPNFDLFLESISLERHLRVLSPHPFSVCPSMFFLSSCASLFEALTTVIVYLGPPIVSVIIQGRSVFASLMSLLPDT
jgi:hypothetical protein